MNGARVPFSTNVTFSGPTGLRVDTDGSIYVIDRTTYVLTKLNADGSLSYQVTSGFFLPQAVAIDSNHNVYVSDTWNSRIVKFNSTGSFLASFSLGGIANPKALSVDGDGNIYVLGNYNSVYKLNSNGTPLFPFNIPNTNTLPNGIISDSYGNLYFPSSTPNNGIFKYSPSGVQLAVYTTSGASSLLPVDVALDGANNIYVANSFNGSIVIFQISNSNSSLSSSSSSSSSPLYNSSSSLFFPPRPPRDCLTSHPLPHPQYLRHHRRHRRMERLPLHIASFVHLMTI